MGELLRLKGDVLEGIDAVYDRLERIAPNADDMRFRRAQYYLRPRGLIRDASDVPRLRTMGRDALESLVQRSNGSMRDKAIASLAVLQFHQGLYAEARELFR